MLGLATAARHEGVMEGKGMGLSAQWAELGLEGENAGITFMPETPAAIALGNACATFGRSEDETMMAIHEGAADEVSKVETRVGVCNVEPNRASVRVTCILGESRQRVLVISEVFGEGGGVEDLGHLIHCEGNQFASLLVAFRCQPIVGKITYFEA